MNLGGAYTKTFQAKNHRYILFSQFTPSSRSLYVECDHCILIMHLMFHDVHNETMEKMQLALIHIKSRIFTKKFCDYKDQGTL